MSENTTSLGRELEGPIKEYELLFDPSVQRGSEYLLDPRSGQKRQLDAHFIGRVGAESVRVIIECRNHKRRQGVDWIEQSVTRKRSLNAGVYILVSSSGFTRPAIKLARDSGIGLRTFKKIFSEDLVEQWSLVQASLFVNESIFRPTLLRTRRPRSRHSGPLDHRAK